MKPEMWSSPQVMNLSANARLLFIGLITQADDEGRGSADPRRLKATIFPGDECTLENVRSWLSECAEQRLATLYEHEGHGQLYELPTWRTHQSIDRPKSSNYPPSTTNRRLFDDDSSEDREGSEGSEGREHISLVFDHWKEVHGHQKAKLDDKRRKVIRAALKNYTADDLKRAISGYKNSPHHMGQNNARTVYDDIELFLRDAKHIDAGLKLANGGQQKWL